MPKISVIIPVYNAEKYLSDAIESVIEQTYDDWEIVAVNDGSTDSSPVILKTYEKRYPTKIRVIHQSNSGLSAARNVAIAASRGEYVAFLDADDLWLPEKIDEQIRVLSTNTDVGLVYSDVYDLKKGKLKKRRRVIGRGMFRGNVLEPLFYHNFIPILSAMVRKSVLEDCGFFDMNLLFTPAPVLW